MDDFFAWAKNEHERVKGARGLVASAFGYAVRHEQALRRFLDDGRLRMTNNHSERALRSIAVGRRNWLFMGSDVHATAAANLFSLIASCHLHGLEPETYLRDIIRVLSYWPRERYLELAPKYWSRTVGRLEPFPKVPARLLLPSTSPVRSGGAGGSGPLSRSASGQSSGDGTIAGKNAAERAGFEPAVGF